MTDNGVQRKPRWLRKRLPVGADHEKVCAIIQKGKLHTVCQEAACPNQFECFASQTATFLILGSQCTRNCRFCNIQSSPVLPNPDPDEPARVAEAVKQMKLGYVVITSVTRDDLPDGGASHFAETIREVRKCRSEVLIEVLIPDFSGDPSALRSVLEAGPDVLNHNIETVPRLYPQVRPQADYQRSLALIKAAAEFDPGMPAKSGLMLGLGEDLQEVRQTLEDLRNCGCRFLTIGQYLQPSKAHLPVQRYVPPEEFQRIHEMALRMGFEEAACGPFVRSSYHAREMYCSRERGR